MVIEARSKVGAEWGARARPIPGFVEDGHFLRLEAGLGPEQLSWLSGPLHQFKMPFHSWPRGRGGWVWARGLTGSHLFIGRIWGHGALGAQMAECQVFPASHQAVGPGVLHISGCPNVNPQRWPGLWPDAQHSLLTPSGPLGCRQVPAGTVGGGVAEKRKRQKRRKGLCEGRWL